MRTQLARFPCVKGPERFDLTYQLSIRDERGDRRPVKVMIISTFGAEGQVRAGSSQTVARRRPLGELLYTIWALLS